VTARECGNCGRPSSDGARLCTTCTKALAAALRGVPELVEDLHITLSKQDRLALSGPMSSKGAEVPLPVRLDVPDAIWTLGNVITTWARELADTHGLRLDVRAALQSTYAARRPARLDPARISGPITSLELAAGWLAEYADRLRTLPDALQAHDEITDAIAYARAVIDRPAARLFVGPCDECGADLYGRPGQTSARCERCGSEHDDLAALWDSALLRLRGYPATAATIAGHIGELYGVQVNRVTISKWHSRGELIPMDWVPMGQGERTAPRFRIGDVLDRARRSKPIRHSDASAG
jgi:predicted Zn-ribbon and HTH transcriptional regulator